MTPTVGADRAGIGEISLVVGDGFGWPARGGIKRPEELPVRAIFSELPRGVGAEGSSTTFLPPTMIMELPRPLRVDVFGAVAVVVAATVEAVWVASPRTWTFIRDRSPVGVGGVVDVVGAPTTG